MPNCTPPRRECAFCHLREQNEETGRLLKTRDNHVTAHFNCMIFSPNAITTNDKEFGGFDIASVKKEVKRGKRMRCSFCKKTGATIGCDVPRCKKTYHYMCAKRDLGLIIENEKEEKYLIYCADHKNVALDTVPTSSEEELDDRSSAGHSGRDPSESPLARHQVYKDLLTAILADQQNSDMESHEYGQEVVHYLSVISASQQKTEAHLRRIGDALWQLVTRGHSFIQADVSHRDGVTQTEPEMPTTSLSGSGGTRQLRRRTAGSSLLEHPGTSKRGKKM